MLQLGGGSGKFGLKACRRTPAKGRMRADGVVEGFEIGKDIVLCSCPCRIVLEVDQFTLEAAEEVLRNGVVIRVAAAGHTLPDAIGFQALPVGPGGILDAPVAVKDQTFGRFTAAIRHIQGCQCQLGIDLVEEGITCTQVSLTLAK